MPKETKANHATYEARVNKVYELLVSGLNRYRIWQYVTSDPKGKELFKGVARRQVDRYIQEANGMLSSEAEFQRTRELGRAIADLNNLKERCKRVQDFGRELAVRIELNKLLGLHPAPAAQTLKIMGVDMGEWTALLQMLDDDGLKPSEVFETMLQEYAAAKKAHR